MSHERWLVSYADFVTLLFALFVVLFASSSIDESRRREFASQFGGSAENGAASYLAPARQSGKIRRRRLLDTYYAMRGQLRREINGGEVELSLQPRGVVVSLREAGFFDAGSAALSDGAEPILQRIAVALAGEPGKLRFEGHTDNRPINTRQFPSNWHLSTARAVSVMRFFAKALDWPAESMAVAGYGEQRPIRDNSTDEGRAANRRVDLVVMAGD